MTAVRGCGTRKTSGVYAETHLGKDGEAVDFFFCDPPMAVQDNMKKVGVSLIEQNGVFHIVDWVGEEHYPTMPDFIDEFRRMGLSRRLPKTLDFSKLSQSSRIILVHAKAKISNPEVLKGTGDCPCFHKHDAHVNHDESCFYNAWEALGDNVKYEAAVFAVFPISQLVQVRDSSCIEDMAKSQLPVQVVDE